MARLVVVEDNPSYAEDVSDYLAKSGHGVRVVADAATLWPALAAEPADAVLLDLGLPDEDGFQVIPKLRMLYPNSGLIVLTARVTFENRIQGLRLGADAYLTKPIKFPELVAHIEAVCRRVLPWQKPEPTPAWQLRTVGCQIEVGDRGALPLTEREFRFLYLLAQNRTPVPRESLLVGLGESSDPAAARKIDMLVYRLRKKIKAHWGIELPLRSAYGGGFLLAEEFSLV